MRKKKIEQLKKIEAQTKKELEKLKAKYAVSDKVGHSFAILAYITIGLFVFFISIGDFIKLNKFIWSKLKQNNGLRELANKINSKKFKRNNRVLSFDESKDEKLDKQNLERLDERIYELSVQIHKNSKL